MAQVESAGVPVEAHTPRMVCMALREDTVTGDMMAAEWVRAVSYTHLTLPTKRT